VAINVLEWIISLFIDVACEHLREKFNQLISDVIAAGVTWKGWMFLIAVITIYLLYNRATVEGPSNIPTVSLSSASSRDHSLLLDLCQKL
jgi:hypothetical protein